MRLRRRTAATTSPDRPAVVLVTGASSGIGRASALRFARDGAALVLCSRSTEVLEEVASQCLRAGAAAALVAPTDVTDRAQVHAAVDRAVTELGGLDVVVSSAAVMSYGSFVDTPPEVYERVVAVDLLGSANVARAALQVFRRQERGTLVVVGSALARVTTPWIASYVSAKWGLRGLTRVLQQEVRDLPAVHVASVAPGAVDTPIYRQAATVLGRHGTPPPPTASPDRIARAVHASVADPRRERDSDVAGGLGNKVMALGFTLTPALFDALVGPLYGRLAFARGHVADTEGNVFTPRPELER